MRGDHTGAAWNSGDSDSNKGLLVLEKDGFISNRDRRARNSVALTRQVKIVRVVRTDWRKLVRGSCAYPVAALLSRVPDRKRLEASRPGEAASPYRATHCALPTQGCTNEPRLYLRKSDTGLASETRTTRIGCSTSGN